MGNRADVRTAPSTLERFQEKRDVVPLARLVVCSTTGLRPNQVSLNGTSPNQASLFSGSKTPQTKES